MGKNPASLFYWGDWQRDLDDHPLDIEGAWIRICCRLHWSKTRGRLAYNLDIWSSILRQTKEDTETILKYIEEKKIGDVTFGHASSQKNHSNVTVTNRRMYSDWKTKEAARLRKQRSRNKKDGHTDVTPSRARLSSVSVSVSKTSSSEQPKPKKIFKEKSVEYRLANLLLKEILKWKPDLKLPNLQSWSKDIDLMIQRDSRIDKDIAKVIVWCQLDSFWQSNILSANKLRSKFDTLQGRMRREQDD